MSFIKLNITHESDLQQTGVTRGPFGWSKTTPARSFAAFGPTF
jgi:hypothetical protein